MENTDLPSDLHHKPRILVVDDEANLPIFLKDFLEENGFEVSMEYSGKSGMRAALALTPDAILLDVDLPDIDGYSLCRTMRRTSTLRTVPIVMLTALDDQKNEIAGLRAGADDYLTKPIDTERLLARLNNAINRNIRELDANPLTHLPGNTSIFQELERRIQVGSPFAVIYADLNNFKAFNDRYGFLRGDQVLKLAAQCLVQSVEKRGAIPSFTGQSFVGHVGGDDFILVVPAEGAEQFCQEVISRFDDMVPNLYDEEDRKRGWIEGKTRQGQPMQFPFVGVALVIVSNTTRPFTHPAEISTLASELKSYAKSFNGKSAYVMDRRRTVEGDPAAPPSPATPEGADRRGDPGAPPPGVPERRHSHEGDPAPPPSSEII